MVLTLTSPPGVEHMLVHAVLAARRCGCSPFPDALYTAYYCTYRARITISSHIYAILPTTVPVSAARDGVDEDEVDALQPEDDLFPNDPLPPNKRF